MIGHPFNPVYMDLELRLFLVKTKKKFLNKANKFHSISMNPIMVKKELPGYLA